MAYIFLISLFSLLALPVYSFLGTGCDLEKKFFDKFACEHLVLILLLNILVWIAAFIIAIYVIIYIVRKIKNKETKFFNKRV